MSFRAYRQFFTNPRLCVITLLGFASGLPLALTSSTLQAWYTVSGIDLLTIGFIGWVGLPYVYKFLWAPLIDRYRLPFLSRRLDWILLTQLTLIAGLMGMAMMDPQDMPWELGLVALTVAFCSATQDTAIDAYRTDLLPAEERGLGTALAVVGYRCAMLVASALALIFADFWGWSFTYFTMAALMGIGLITTWFSPHLSNHIPAPASLKAAVVEPFREFLSRPQAWLLLAFILLYKLGDAFAGSLSITFLIRGVGFDLVDVGTINKTVGITATLLGVLVAGLLMVRWSLWRSLFWFGVLQAVSNLMLMLLAIVGKNYALMIVAIFIENFCGGLGTAAFTAFIMSLCDARYTATQFALLSSLASIGRVLIGPIAAQLVLSVGWVHFFFCSTLLALPALLLVPYLTRKVRLNEPLSKSS